MSDELHPEADPKANIPIHIDKQLFKVNPGSLTGAELRNLPTPPIGGDRELYLVRPGRDDLVVGDTDSIPVKAGLHFVTAPRNVTPG
jgi:hypothetical protein